MNIRILLALMVAVPLAVPTAAATVFYAEDFEDGATPFGWVLTSLWEVSTCNPSSGLYALTYASPPEGCTFDAGITAGTATMPSFVVPAGPSYLLFESFLSTEHPETDVLDPCPPCDRAWLEISTDGGATWTTLFVESTEDAWNLRVVTLTSYAGDEIVLRFAFETVDEYYNDFAGWSIDNVVLSDVPPPVPELSTLGLMAAGVGLVGFVALRRRS